MKHKLSDKYVKQADQLAALMGQGLSLLDAAEMVKKGDDMPPPALTQMQPGYYYDSDGQLHIYEKSIVKEQR